MIAGAALPRPQSAHIFLLSSTQLFLVFFLPRRYATAVVKTIQEKEMLSSSACAPPRAFSAFRRVPLIVLHVEAGAPLVRAAGPRVNTAELREEWFESELAGWCRAKGCIAGLEAAEAIPGEPFGRWIGAEVSHG